VDELELVSIKVGEIFPLFNESTTHLRGQDGAFFEASSHNQGYMFCIYNYDLHFMEIQTYKNANIEVRILQGSDGMILPLLRFGKTNVIYEMVFDPTKYEDDRALQFLQANNLLLISVIESRNGILKYMREATNFPLKFIQICKEAWSRALMDLNFSDKYTVWIEKMRRYDLITLWNRATPVGVLGESFNLNDIRTPNQYKPQKDLDGV
jgi:hypothetical protein